MRDKLDHFRTGIVLGLIGPWIGFCLYGLYYGNKFLVSFSYFVNSVFLGTRSYQSPIASLSLLFNLAIFLLFLRFDLEEGARGILMGTFIYVPIIVFLFFY
ncbi:MAG: hypothetical protein V4616_05360 [Bacteroidota bacterium]